MPPPILFGADLGAGWPSVALSWSVAALGAVAFTLLIGRRRLQFLAARETPLAAESAGLNIASLRFRAFLFSAGCAGAAGALQVQLVGVVSPEALGFEIMVVCLAIAVIGGRGSAPGAMLAALLLLHLPEWLRFLEERYLLAYGIGMLAVILVAPKGLAGLFAAASAGARDWKTLAIAASEPDASRRLPLETQDVVKRYGGVTAVDHASLRIEPGEILGLIGPNGSGKSTLLNILSGIARPDSGRVLADGKDVTTAPAHAMAAAGLGRGFQTPLLPEEAPAIEAAGARGALPEAAAALARVGFPTDRFGARCGDLPHGQRRQVDIARALAGAPRVLLLDEPASGLTPDERAEIGALLRALADDGVACVVVDHTIDFLAETADRLVCMDRGRIIADGDPNEVSRDPA